MEKFKFRPNQEHSRTEIGLTDSINVIELQHVFSSCLKRWKKYTLRTFQNVMQFQCRGIFQNKKGYTLQICSESLTRLGSPLHVGKIGFHIHQRCKTNETHPELQHVKWPKRKKCFVPIKVFISINNGTKKSIPLSDLEPMHCFQVGGCNV